MNWTLLLLLAYSALLIGLGAYLARRVRSATDFLVAGRRLGPGLIFTTFLAANIGAGSTVNVAARGYTDGWSAWWWVGSAGIGCLILAHTIGPRIWRIAHDRRLHTLGDYLEFRYNRAVRGVVAIILWIGTLGLLAAQIMAISIILHVVMGIPKWQGCVWGGLVMISYFTAGGLFSSAWVNLVELFVLIVGFVLAIPYGIDSSGGWDQVVSRLSGQLGDTATQQYLSPVGIGMGGVLYYVALLTPSFIVSPGLIQKVYGARSESAVRMGVSLNGVALLLFSLIPTCIGIIAAARLPELPDPESALPSFMIEILPHWLAVLGLAAIFSAEVSTCDAVLFMLSTSLTVDLYRAFIHPRASEARLLRVSRISSVTAGLLGIVVAIAAPSILSSLTLFYSLVSVSLFVPVVSGVYSKKPTAAAALSSILISVPATLGTHHFLGGRFLGILNPFALGILVSLVVFWTVSARQKKL